MAPIRRVRCLFFTDLSTLLGGLSGQSLPINVAFMRPHLSGFNACIAWVRSTSYETSLEPGIGCCVQRRQSRGAIFAADAGGALRPLAITRSHVTLTVVTFNNVNGSIALVLRCASLTLRLRASPNDRAKGASVPVRYLRGSLRGVDVVYAESSPALGNASASRRSPGSIMQPAFSDY